MERNDVDTGWAWVSLVGACCCYGLLAFVHYSTGIFCVALLSEYDHGQALTAVVGSVSACLIGVSGPFVGVLINATSCRVAEIFGGTLLTLGLALSYFVSDLKILILTLGVITGPIVGNLINATSCRVAEIFGGSLLTLGLALSYFVSDLKILILTLGVITGVGLSFTAIPTYVIAGYSFDKYRGLAVGLVFARGGIGMFASGQVTQTLLDTYGLQGTLLLVGGISFHVVFFGALMRPSRLKIFHQSERKKSNNACRPLINIFDSKVLKNKAFLLILRSMLLWHGTCAIVTIYLPNYAVVKGTNKMEASILILETGVGGILSRILTGLLSGEKSGVDPILFNMGAIGITGLITLLFPFFSSSFWEQSLFAVMYGIYSGTLFTLVLPVTVEMVGLSKMPSGVGLINFAGGIGSISCPIIAGWIVDKTDKYDYSFYFAGGCFILGFLAVLLSTLWRSKDMDTENDLPTQTSLKGSNVLYSSGFLGGSIPMELHLADNISPGIVTNSDTPLLQLEHNSFLENKES